MMESKVFTDMTILCIKCVPRSLLVTHNMNKSQVIAKGNP